MNMRDSKHPFDDHYRAYVPKQKKQYYGFPEELPSLSVFEKVCISIIVGGVIFLIMLSAHWYCK